MVPRSATRKIGLTGLAFLALTLGAYPMPAQADPATPVSAVASRWVVDGPTARALIDAGAVVLDTRVATQTWWTPLPGAIPVRWQAFTGDAPAARGQLLPDDAVLSQKVRALGISQDKPVVVVGDLASGWGEDGRIVWTLRTLGHPAAVLVDGGVAALTTGGTPRITAPSGLGTFTVRRTAEFDVAKEDVRLRLGAPGVVILDTREDREFAGATPYGESRGGHVPGARHLYFKDLAGRDGRLLSGDALKAKLATLGIGKETEVIAYCTGGIRSAFVTAVLRDAGVNAKNYSGSMWEWSAAPAADYPLQTTGR